MHYELTKYHADRSGLFELRALVFIRRFAKTHSRSVKCIKSREFGSFGVASLEIAELRSCRFQYVKFKLHRFVTRESRKYKTQFCRYGAVKESAQPRFA